jgi:hypothetical protein
LAFASDDSVKVRAEYTHLRDWGNVEMVVGQSLSSRVGRLLDSIFGHWNFNDSNGRIGHLCKVLDYAKLNGWFAPEVPMGAAQLIASEGDRST